MKTKSSLIYSVIAIVLLLAVVTAGFITFRNYQTDIRKIALQEERDFVRLTDVNVIAGAISKYSLQGGSAEELGIGEEPRFICKLNNTDCKNYINLKPLINLYLVDVPSDPGLLDAHNAGYMVQMHNGDLLVSAPYAELEDISAMR